MPVISDPYKNISNEYDGLIGPRDEISFLKKLIHAHHRKAESMLELACGTGALLKNFSDKYKLSGLDNSGNMLKVAKTVIPSCKFYNKNMTNFRISQQFDIITCLFNSMNHLRNFTSWKGVFRSSAKHLSEGGVFIFDIMTPLGLKNYSSDPHKITYSKNSIMTTEYSLLPDGAFQFKAGIFTRQKGNIFMYKQTRIVERAFDTESIKSALQKHFSSVKIIDPDRKRPGKNSEVLYFICKA